jgi:hypothetical protein
MTKSSKRKDLKRHLDHVEAKLTPNELAIKCIDEIRRYPTLLDFLKAQAKLTYPESELAKAYKALSQQAQDRCPGSTPQEIDARKKLKQTLITKFSTRMMLVMEVNRTIELERKMFAMSGLLIQSQRRHLQHLIWQDHFLSTASAAAEWIKRNKSGNRDRKQRREILQRLAAYPKVMRQVPSLLPKSWIITNSILLLPLYACQMAVQDVQTKYFDGHPILSHEFEDALKDGIDSLLKASDAYKEYVKLRDLIVGLRNRSQDGAGAQNELEGEPEFADLDQAIQKAARVMADEIVNDWVTDARDHIPPSTPEHQDVFWKNFQKKHVVND